MKTKNPMQFKSYIKKMAAEKGISAQIVMQNYVLERLLERISLSPYRRNFVIKGGFLIAAIVGLDTRATMDLDTTFRGLELTHENIRNIFEEVSALKAEDDITFEVVNTADIRETDDYPGIRVSLKARYAPISVPFAVDVSTGDRMTPREVEFAFPLMFDEREITIMAYNLETMLAEKLETVISRGIANTRSRDFYDIFILWKLRGEDIVPDVLQAALEQTVEKRGSKSVMTRYDSILSDIRADGQTQNFWTKYQEDFDYAKSISFEEVVTATREILTGIL